MVLHLDVCLVLVVLRRLRSTIDLCNSLKLPRDAVDSDFPLGEMRDSTHSDFVEYTVGVEVVYYVPDFKLIPELIFRVMEFRFSVLELVVSVLVDFISPYAFISDAIYAQDSQSDVLGC